MTFAWSLVLTLLLSSFPLTPELLKWTPHWSLLLIIWWSLGTGKNSSILGAWCAGIPLDVLWGNPLGLNGLIFAVVTYLLSIVRPKIKRVNMIRQSIIVFIILVTAQATGYWARALFTIPVDFKYLIVQAFLTAIVWPLVLFVYDWIDEYLWRLLGEDKS